VFQRIGEIGAGDRQHDRLEFDWDEPTASGSDGKAAGAFKEHVYLQVGVERETKKFEWLRQRGVIHEERFNRRTLVSMPTERDL
jgi:hypothetical protein